jgi:hypothetical protein
MSGHFPERVSGFCPMEMTAANPDKKPIRSQGCNEAG